MLKGLSLTLKGIDLVYLGQYPYKPLSDESEASIGQ
jgi:hypothetical protein